MGHTEETGSDNVWPNEREQFEEPTMSARISVPALFARADQAPPTDDPFDATDDTRAYPDGFDIKAIVAQCKAARDNKLSLEEALEDVEPAELAEGSADRAGSKGRPDSQADWDESTNLLERRARSHHSQASAILPMDLPLQADDESVYHEDYTIAEDENPLVATSKRLARGSRQMRLDLSEGPPMVQARMSIPWLHELDSEIDLQEDPSLVRHAEGNGRWTPSYLFALISTIGAALALSLVLMLAAGWVGLETSNELTAILASLSASVSWFVARAMYPTLFLPRVFALSAAGLGSIGLALPPAAALVVAPMAVVVSAGAFLLGELLEPSGG